MVAKPSDDSADPPITEAQRAERPRRLEAYRAESDAGSSWEEVRDRIRRSKQRGR